MKKSPEEQEAQAERSAYLAELAQEPDVAAAVLSAKQHLAPQYAPFGLEPVVYVVESRGLAAVALPWTAQRRMLAVRQTANMDKLEQGLKLSDAIVTDCLWWIRGQQMDGRPGALKHVRGLVDVVGGRYINLMMELGLELMSLQINAEDEKK